MAVQEIVWGWNRTALLAVGAAAGVIVVALIIHYVKKG